MLNLKNIEIKKNYDSDKDDLLKDFFIPVLSTAVLYRRLAGFFSSGIFSAASRGIKELIDNNGKMQLIIGVQVNEEDYLMLKKIVKESKELPEKYITNKIDNLEEFLKSEHVEAMGWMILNNLLDIKFAVTNRGGIFHMKVGIVTDKNGDSLSFSGSDNETPSGWKHNVEEFKVFRKWIDSEADYFNADEEKFNRFWNDKGNNVTIFELPKAIKEKIVKSVPKEQSDLKIFKNENNLDSNIYLNTPVEIKLRPHQKEAIKKWENNSYKGILAMATGSGKTKSALYAVKNLLNNDKSLCVIIAVPFGHLINQWITNDIRLQFPDISIIEASSENTKWRSQLKLMLEGYSKNITKVFFIVTTYATLSSDDFINIFLHKYNNNLNYFLIADEVHNLGAKETQRAMLVEYNYRMGLTATPKRHFDDLGTDKIIKYFNKIVYEYELKDAIRDGYLVKYKYYPIIIEMTDEEYDEYNNISQKISKRAAILNLRKSDILINNDLSLQILLQKRSKIIKESSAKIPILDKTLKEMKKKGSIDHLLIYCDNIKQLEKVQVILYNEGIISHQFTKEESLKERRNILDHFIQGNYKCLVAIKCLDEGVDVPSIKTAIIIASTTNPREYIQRRGRVLRKEQNKENAIIYDFIVIPKLARSSEIDQYEKQILRKELTRVLDFIETAENKSEIFRIILDLMEKFNLYI